jgi:hypothetical protein
LESPFHLPAAFWAYRKRPGLERPLPGPPAFLKNLAAPVAFQENLPSLDRDQGDKKKAQVMIHTFEPGRGQAAIRADPCLIIDSNFFGLYPADKNESAPPALSPSSRSPGKPGREFRFYNLSFFRPASKKKTILQRGPIQKTSKNRLTTIGASLTMKSNGRVKYEGSFMPSHPD